MLNATDAGSERCTMPSYEMLALVREAALQTPLEVMSGLSAQVATQFPSVFSTGFTTAHYEQEQSSLSLAPNEIIPLQFNH